MPVATADILRSLSDNAGTDFANAQSLPPAIYHNQEIYDLEVGRLFHRGWICVGRTAEIPNPGDFISYDIVGEPIFVIRQKNRTIKAFPNVCLHRCSRLLDGEGHVSKVSCPYHSWTYDLGGQLIGAPFMQKTPNFDRKSYRLDQLSCETWEGFIYVSLDPDASPIASKLQNLQNEIAEFRMADYVPVYQEHEVWHTNWKCLVENFMDVYHLHRVHADSFNKYSSYEHATELFPGEDAYSYHFVQEDAGAHSVAANPDNSWLKGDKRHRTYLINLFPAHVVQLQPDMLWYLSILPDGLDRVKIRWAMSIPSEILQAAQDRDAVIAGQLDLLKQVNSEDRPTVERVFQGTQAVAARQGPLSWLERNCWDFGRYLARELGA